MKTAVFIISLCFTITTFAQNYDFGKISKEELEETHNPMDSSANATYLYKYRRTHYQYIQNDGFKVVTDVHERIKIYNQEGFNYATKIIGLSKNNSDKEKMNNLKAYTYNIENGKVEDTKIDKDAIFNTEESIYYNETKFTMPNIKPGCIIEYKYTIESPFLANVDEYVFQHSIPIKKLEAEFEAPEYFNFKLNTKGYLTVIPKTETSRGKITFNSKTRSGFYTSETTFSSSDIEFEKKLYTFKLDNVPSLKEEPYINNINNYRSTIKYELSYTKFPNSTMEYFSSSWEDVVKTIYKSSNFGDELDKKGYYENDIDALIGSISDPLQRTALIFNFVKSKINWNGYYGKYTKEGVKKAYKNQVGNVAEINLMLTSMLRHAGLNAYPVLVSTRENGVPLFPTLDGYNYVVCYVKLLEGGFLLDATNKYSAPNVLPYRTLNWQGRVVSESGGSEFIDLYPSEKSDNNIMFMVNLKDNGNIDGAYRSLKTNHDALMYRERYNNANKDDYLEKLENRYNGLEISDFEVKNDNDLSQPIMESYKFSKESQADIIGDKLYFPPMFFLKTNENPFKLEKREYPVDFGYPSSTVYRINVNLPEGYKVESLPKPEAFMLPDNLGVFKYNISATEKAIQLTISAEINKSIITPIYYDALKAYFSKIVENEAEQIVLKKI